jgi:UDP-N-acetylmuramate-alanine ligase
MANMALILKKMGKNVTGSDVAEEFITEPVLKKNNLPYFLNFQKKLLPKNTDLVIYSAANGGKENPQVKEALKRKINVVHQAEILGEIMSLFKNRIAVCGSHGKTTTAAWLAYSLIQLQMKPSYLVGAPSFHQFFGGDFKKRDFFIAEADEYALDTPRDKTPKFYYLKPKRIICTNIDFDHPDVYRNVNQIIKTFTNFFNNLPLIINIDNQYSFQCFLNIKNS